MQIIDINDQEWTEKSGISSTGKRVKAWYERNSDGKTFLHKEPKIYKGINFVTFELITEIIAYYIGIELGLNLPAIYPAKCKGYYGVLIENFLHPGEIFYEIKEFLTSNEVKHSHNISSIEFLFKNVIKDSSIWNEYKKMLVYDCLIGNNDRHDQNWGLCLNLKENKLVAKPTFAPIYDNASCLTRELNEEGVKNILKNEQAFNKYVFGKNSRPPNLYWDLKDEKKYNHFDLIKKLIEKEPQTIAIIEDFLQIDYFESVNDTISKIRLLDLPEEYRLSDNRVEAIFKILKARKEKLQELL